MATTTSTSVTTVSAPMTFKAEPSNVLKLQRIPATTSPAKIAKIIYTDGAVVLENFLTEDQVRGLNADLNEPLKKLSPAGLLDTSDEIKAFNGSNTKRLTDLITLSKTWREELVNNDVMHAVCEEILSKQVGGYWLSAAQMMEIGPGNPRQPLHRDFGNWWPNWNMGPSAPETLLNFLLATTNTREENGATRVIPGSNQWDFSDKNYNLGSDDMSLPAELNAGDCLLIGGRIVHGGGHNATTDYYRRLISVAICANCFAQEEAFALTVDMATVKKLPERVQKFLGFRSQYPLGSPGLWMKDADDIAKHIGLA